MNDRFYDVFEQWKKMQTAEWGEYETWFNALSAEEMQLTKAFKLAYDYGFNTGYEERQLEEKTEDRT